MSSKPATFTPDAGVFTDDLGAHAVARVREWTRRRDGRVRTSSRHGDGAHGRARTTAGKTTGGPSGRKQQREDADADGSPTRGGGGAEDESLVGGVHRGGRAHRGGRRDVIPAAQRRRQRCRRHHSCLSHVMTNQPLHPGFRGCVETEKERDEAVGSRTQRGWRIVGRFVPSPVVTVGEERRAWRFLERVGGDTCRGAAESGEGRGGLRTAVVGGLSCWRRWRRSRNGQN